MILRFDQAEVKKEADRAEPGCTVAGETLVRKGTFRGRIKLDDRKSFGQLNLSESPGTITDFPAETCPASKPGASTDGAGATAEEESSTGALSTSLHVGRKLDGGDLSFDVETYPAGLVGDKGAPQFDFVASYFKTRRGLSSFATVQASLVRRGFGLTAAGEATVDPPAPFSGSAIFKLESATTASWSGDLAADIPTLGKVSLTGPGTWSTLCQGAHCTDTVPSGIGFGLLGSD